MWSVTMMYLLVIRGRPAGHGRSTPAGRAGGAAGHAVRGGSIGSCAPRPRERHSGGPRAGRGGDDGVNPEGGGAHRRPEARQELHRGLGADTTQNSQPPSSPDGGVFECSDPVAGAPASIQWPRRSRSAPVSASIASPPGPETGDRHRECATLITRRLPAPPDPLAPPHQRRCPQARRVRRLVNPAVCRIREGGVLWHARRCRGHSPRRPQIPDRAAGS